MTTMEEMSALAERMVPVAMRMVGAVHDDGVGAIARTLAPLTDQERIGLIVVLAGMVDPDRPVSELLAWVTWDGTPVDAPSLFSLVPVLDELSDNPHQWSDLQCYELAKRHRRMNVDLTPFEEARLLLGYREWDRRRKARKRATTTRP